MPLPGLRLYRSVFAAAAVLALVLSLVGGAGCSAPILTHDGQLVFQEKGARGASVITANGVEFLDRNDVPRIILRRSSTEAWRPATGFLMPSDGIWRKTSTPVAVQGPGLAVVLRSSDVLIPSWGGEILLRMDAIAPVAAFPAAASSVRPALRLAIIVDGTGADTAALADVALDNLGAADRVGILDATLARPVLPLLPGSHHTLLHAAVERLLAQTEHARSSQPASRDLAGALTMARAWIGAVGHDGGYPHTPGPGASTTVRQVLVLTDGAGVARGGALLGQEVRALAAAGIELVATATDQVTPGALAALGGSRAGATGSLDDRKEVVNRAVPPPGDIVLDDVTLSTSSIPAPARMIEVSGGDAALGLDADHLSLGQVYAGEARTEVARVVLPPGSPASRWSSPSPPPTATSPPTASRPPTPASAAATPPTWRRSPRARHGDVIAYASALAMVRRLHRAFLGSEVDRPGGVRRIAGLQAASLGELGRAQNDPALLMQAEILTKLLGVIED